MHDCDIVLLCFISLRGCACFLLVICYFVLVLALFDIFFVFFLGCYEMFLFVV